MSSANDQNLQQAYDLIEANKLDEARAILQPLLTSDKDNPDVWWIYAHTVEDPEEARRALNTIRRLDPNYPGASNLAETLESRFPAPSGIKSLSRSAVSEPDFFEDTVNQDEEDFDLEDEEADETAQPSAAFNPRRLLIPLVAIVVLVIVIVAVLIISNPPQPTVTPASPTQVISAETSTPIPAESATSVEDATQTPAEDETATPLENATPTSEISAQAVPSDTSVPTIIESETLVPATEVPAETANPGDDFAALQTALSELTLAADGIQNRQTALGNTLVVSVCTTNSELGATLTKVMGILAQQSGSLQAEAVGVQLVNCDDQRSIRTIGVKIADAAAYASGSSSDRDFKSKWQPIE